MKEENKDKQMKFKQIVYEKEDRMIYGETIPDDITILGNRCFEKSSFTEIIIPSNVKIIKPWCFSQSYNISKMIIPDSVTKIEMCAFKGCSNLTSVVMSSNSTEISYGIFENCINLKEIHIPQHLNTFPLKCFNNCNSLSEIEIPSSVEWFGKKCFNNCSILKSIRIPSSVKSIETKSFKNCKQLEELIIENEKICLKSQFFEGCTSLTKIQIPTINGYCLYIPSNEEKKILERNGIKMYHYFSNPIVRKELKSIEIVNDEILSIDDLKCYNYTSLYIPSTISKLETTFFFFYVEEYEGTYSSSKYYNF